MSRYRHYGPTELTVRYHLMCRLSLRDHDCTHCHALLLSSSCSGAVSHFSGYVDNVPSTAYLPREIVAYGEGERYGGTPGHPSAPGIPAAQAVALFQCPESRLHCGLSGPYTRTPLCAVDAGSHTPRPQKLRGPDAQGAPGHPL